MLSLDWLSVVINSDRQEIISYLVSRLSGSLAVQFSPCGGVHGYEASQRSEGCVIAFGGENQRQTMLVSLSGEACQVLQWYGSAALLRELIERFKVKIKFSRVDLALDLPGERWKYFDTPKKVFQRLQDGRIKSVAIVDNYERQIDDSGVSENWVITGHTTYIGSRTSERFMRIYKKLLHNGTKVTRFEYELKYRYALVVGSMMLTGESIGAAYIFANTKHVRIDDLCSLSIMYEAYSISLPKKKERSTFLWLLAVSKAIVEYMDNNPEGWRVVIEHGWSKTPGGNTGVHIQEPVWLQDVSQQAMNLEVFGLNYHPLCTDKKIFSA